MTHPPCQCNEPTGNCPRYGWMKGQRWKQCQGIDISKEDRDKYLDLYASQKDQPSKIVKFAEATIKYFFAGRPKVSDEQYAERLNICANCEFCNKETMPWTCNICGCNLQEGTIMPGKARWATEDCPYPTGSKWPKINLPLVEQGTNWAPPCGSCGKSKA